jgi:hypothetical protein
LRAHVAGKEVAVVATWGSVKIFGDGFFSPRPLHDAQVFSHLGITTVYPPDACVRGDDHVTFSEDQVAALDVDTLFLHTRHLNRHRVETILRSQAFAQVPAVREGRVFDLGWEFVNSGWFGANWQLRQVATAFGLSQLRAGHHTAEGGECLVVDPAAGLVTLAGVGASARRTLVGPQLLAEIDAPGPDAVAQIVIPGEASQRMCDRPEDYEIRSADGGVHRLEHDRESALESLHTRHHGGLTTGSFAQ